MLTELHIENFAIIDKLELHFEPGLITFTGETGAGKSIIMGALETLLGSRADNTLIRSEAERANIEATFRIAGHIQHPLHEILKKEDLLDDPDYVTLGREIRRNDRNIARINGRSVGVHIMREVGEFLVDIHGQSEHLSLLRVRQHLGLLDRFTDLSEIISPYQKTYKRIIAVRKELDTLRQAERDAARRMDLLTYQINEIEAANLKSGEDDELQEERNRLANAEGLATLSQESLQLIDEGTLEIPGIIDQIGQVIENLTDLSRIDSSRVQFLSDVNNIFEETQELSRQLRDYLESIEFNPKRLEQVEERLELINNLKRKYGATIENVLAFEEKSRQELDTITNAGERIIELEKEERELLVTLGEQGMALSQKRHAAAEKLEKALETELDDLKMSGARFQVEFQQHADPEGVLLPNGDRVAFDINGLERVEFMIETNPGEGFKPLVKIASGGETSRLMLALKNVLARADHVPTLVFDEIDQGIGGRVGSIVGEKLWSLATQHQVMCITHLPQLAAFGQQHFQVDKQIEGGRTITQVTQIEGEARIKELALMLGEVSAGTLQSAQEIMDYVNNLENSLKN
jgi:DNA repair protein RecN (Recombination protein N)